MLKRYYCNLIPVLPTCTSMYMYMYPYPYLTSIRVRSRDEIDQAPLLLPFSRVGGEPGDEIIAEHSM